MAVSFPEAGSSTAVAAPHRVGGAVANRLARRDVRAHKGRSALIVLMVAIPLILLTAIGSILVGLVVLALKTFAWWLTGSVALMSDAMESIVNVATAVAALIAIRIAARPADRDHPYGHHKAEFFSAVLEGVMIIVAALLILREAWHAFQAPRMLEAPLEGLLVNGFASVLNAGWCWVPIPIWACAKRGTARPMRGSCCARAGIRGSRQSRRGGSARPLRPTPSKRWRGAGTPCKGIAGHRYMPAT